MNSMLADYQNEIVYKLELGETNELRTITAYAFMLNTTAE